MATFLILQILIDPKSTLDYKEHMENAVESQQVDYSQVVYPDNFNETVDAVRKFILENAPEGLDKWSRESLERSVQETFSWVSCEWRLEHASANLYVEFASIRNEEVGRFWFEDSNGNKWTKHQVRCTVNYPSYGSGDIPLVKSRLALVNSVVELAEKIHNEFSFYVYSLLETRADAEQKELQKQVKVLQQKVDKIILELPRSHMRVNAEKLIADKVDLTPGTYEGSVGPKRYRLEVSSGCPHFLTRIA